MDTVHPGNGLRRAGLVVFACGLGISALGVSVAVPLLPPGIMIVLLGTVLIVPGVVRELPD
jgi:hypothetical protein